ncbi:hypothetical protein IQ268_07055 [Oculatella sp. LEGE 06141]|uniref:hypothetical protein n=1 Tax=Oculatella sp. LEGE 06141 TaxID=1828648 RepID=UPI0018821875|nr:hypothetical protein [Oculatella sp. LEGE 06141]MBE9178345.1 hypothetical protein [Oculatella sp. LEGE 06141]
MANRSRRLTSQPQPSESAIVPAEPSEVKVNILVSSSPGPIRRSWRSGWISTVTLLGMAGAVVGGGWLAVQLIINPGSVEWLSWLLPEWSQRPLTRWDAPKPLSEIRAEAKQEALLLGVPLALKTEVESTDELLLFPVLADAVDCSLANVPASASCGSIVELRVYRVQAGQSAAREEQVLILHDRLAVKGLQELEAIAPLVQSAVTNPGSTRILPLERVNVIAGKTTAPGMWLILSGTWARGSNRVVYGHVIHYDPGRSRLESLLSWTSPSGKIPYWQEMTGGELAELVVDQSIGLEPEIELYQVKASGSSARPMRLEALSLTESALADRTYENALVLARNGLWSPALQVMQSVKQRQGQRWTAAAQAQLDLVAAHAAITKANADRLWASPSQQVSALLIDGRWATALQSVQTALQEGYELPGLIATDADRLWRRVDIALRMNASRPDVLTWGALLTYSQQGREAAIVWTRQRTSTLTASAATSSRVMQVLNLIDRPTAATTAAANSDPANPDLANPDLANQHSSQLIGTATPLTTVTLADWLPLQPDSPPTLPTGQRWYQIRVSEFYDGERWRRSPASDLSTAKTAQPIANQLGLAAQPSIQIAIWTNDAQPQVVQSTVTAVRSRNGELQLLAVGDAPRSGTSVAEMPFPPLAITLNTLAWSELGTAIALAGLEQQQPAQLRTLLPLLWRELQQSDRVLPIQINSEQLLPEVGGLPVQLVDLTGNGQPEALVTVSSQELSPRYSATSTEAGTALPPAQTLIFSDQGILMYSELTQSPDQTFMGVIQPQAGAAQAILVQQSQGYRLLRWSSQAQRFE